MNDAAEQRPASPFVAPSYRSDTGPDPSDASGSGDVSRVSVRGVGFWKEAGADVSEVKRRYDRSALSTILCNRGFHALTAYRISHKLMHRGVPLVPLVLTRLVQILYGIEIDPRASVSGGVVILHGVGLVIGHGVQIGSGVLLHHGVTLGIKGGGRDDGFPTVGEGCVIGAGAKLLGDIEIGHESIIGPNVVLTRSVPPRSLVKVPDPVIRQRSGHASRGPQF